jgi:hypothetical protein
MKKYFLLFIIPVILFSDGCKKNNDTDTGKTVLFTFNVMPKFIPTDLSVIVFLNDSLGNVIADTLCTQPGRYIFYDNKGNAPSRFSVTVVTYRFFVHNFLVTLNTWEDISTSEWFLAGTTADSTGHAAVTLDNLPSSPGLVLYSTAGYSNLTSEPGPQTMMLYRNTDHFYARVNTSQGPRYKWVDGIMPGQAYHVDMSTADSSAVDLVTFPMTAQYYEATIYGYDDPDYQSKTPYTVEQLLGNGNPVNSVTVSHPLIESLYFLTNLHLLDSWTSGYSWDYRTKGIPASFQKIDADLSGVMPSTGQVTFQAGGNFNVAGASWVFYANNNQVFNWNIFGPESKRNFKLPQLSRSFMETFPVLAVDSLQFDRAQLYNYPELSSYQELIQRNFMMSNVVLPKMYALNVASVSFAQGKK